MEVEIKSGDVAVFNILADTSYRITHEGWTLRVECTNGELRSKCNHDGTIQICSEGGNHDM